MVRDFADRPLDPAVIERMLRNATRAPSAGFSQGWSFLVLQTPDDVARWWRTTAGAATEAPDRWLTGMMRAPLLIVPCAEPDQYLQRYAAADKAGSTRPDPPARASREGWPVPYWLTDTGMATLLILQTAVDEDLGACFFGIPAASLPAIREEFGIPGSVEPIGVIAVGHRAATTGPAGSPARRPRRPIEELVHRGNWA